MEMSSQLVFAISVFVAGIVHAFAACLFARSAAKVEEGNKNPVAFVLGGIYCGISAVVYTIMWFVCVHSLLQKLFMDK